MKIAIALYGDYSEWWKKNDYFKEKTDDIYFFGFTFSHVSDTSVFTNHKYIESPIEKIIPRVNRDYQRLSRVLTYDYCCQQLAEMIDSTFDILIFTTFKSILVQGIPSTKGIYYTPYYSFTNIEFTIPLECIEIVSSTCVRYNGGIIKRISDLSLQDRYLLFQKLFPDKVYDFTEDFEYKSNGVMLIPSVINISVNPFDYSAYRSVFTPLERLDQTIEQIKSINEQGLNSILLEGSELDLFQLDRLAVENTTIVLFCKDQHGYIYANEHPNKSIYEIYVMGKMLKTISCNWFFKFGGRYKIASFFDLSQFTRDKPVYKIIPGEYALGGQTIIECILYSFPYSRLKEFQDIYDTIMINVQTTSEGIETLLYKNSTDFYRVHDLGIMGMDAIEGFERIV
jgi:hypothetical protein